MYSNRSSVTGHQSLVIGHQSLVIGHQSSVKRIIDVNLNRATEGLRVVEEICRFVLEDRRLTVMVKKLRGNISRVIRGSGDQVAEYQGTRRSGTLLEERDAAGDVGREPYTKDEGRRTKLADVFRANMKRAEEAVRVLEEFAKLLEPIYGRKFKAIRFKLYGLEKELAVRVSRAEKLDFDLYLIIDPAVHKKPLKLLRPGVKIVQLRAKALNNADYLRLAKKIARAAKRKGITFLLNDHWQLVKPAGADGVHLGWKDLPAGRHGLKGVSFKKIRQVIGGDKLIGLSAQNLNEAKRAAELHPDYIGFGPLFATPVKPGVRPAGLRVLSRVVKNIKIPIVAIGGINRSNIDSVRNTGCQRYAAIRGGAELSG